jgi:hypothetical protein
VFVDQAFSSLVLLAQKMSVNLKAGLDCCGPYMVGHGAECQ